MESDAQIFEVPDASLDDRFSADSLVTGESGIRHYAGATIRQDGFVIGTLGVMDRTPRVLATPQRAALLELAHAVEQLVRERKLHRELRAQLAKVYVETPALLYLLDGTGAVTEVSDLWLEHFGYRRESVIGRNAREFMSPSARETFLIARERLWTEGGCRDYPCQFLTAAGNPVDVLISATIERRASGEPVRVKCVLVDITRQLQMQASLEVQAHVDKLTGIANRAFFCEHLDLEIDRARRYSRPLSLIMFDVDRFKRLNDKFGHPMGDRALVALSKVARSQLRDCDFLGRIGGEEFAILLPETPLPNAVHVAERLRIAVESIGLDASGVPIPLTISIGVAPIGPSVGAEEAFVRADSAMYAAKRAGRNQVVAINRHLSFIQEEGLPTLAGLDLASVLGAQSWRPRSFETIDPASRDNATGLALIV